MSQAIQGVPIPTGGNGQFISEWIKSLLSLGTLFILKQYTYHLCAIALFLSHSIAFSAFATPTKINGLFTIISLHIKQIHNPHTKMYQYELSGVIIVKPGPH